MSSKHQSLFFKYLPTTQAVYHKKEKEEYIKLKSVVELKKILSELKKDEKLSPLLKSLLSYEKADCEFINTLINNTTDDLKDNIKELRSYLLDCNISYDYGTELMGGADLDSELENRFRFRQIQN